MSMMSMDSMYQQIILDHYKNPQHHGLPDDFDAEVHHVNPTCGDEVTLRVKIADGTIRDLGWDGEGCSISQASTSVMSELVAGKPVQQAMQLQARFLELMQSRGEAELTEHDEDELEDAVAFEGVSKYPARVKCALLGWMAMKSAVAEAGWSGTAEAAGPEHTVEDVVDSSAEMNTPTPDVTGAQQS